jgi:hypothetical protein
LLPIVQDVKKRRLSTKEKQKTNANQNMKRKFQIILSAAAASALSFSALAQDTPNPKINGPLSTDRTLHAQRPNQLKYAAINGPTSLNPAMPAEFIAPTMLSLTSPPTRQRRRITRQQTQTTQRAMFATAMTGR